MNVWLVQGWWYRDPSSKIFGLFATRKAADREVAKLRKSEGEIWNYEITRSRVKS